MDLTTMYPDPLLNGVKDGSNVLILNTQYQKTRKRSDGSYEPDKLYIVYRDNDTQKKKLQIIQNPTCNVYTTKQEYLNDFKTTRDALSVEKLDKHTVIFKDRESFLYKRLKENLLSDRDKTVKATIDRAVELGKYSGKKEIHKWRHAYYSDFDIKDYAHTSAFLHYQPKVFILNKSYLDIESDVYGYTKTDQNNGACSINAITIIYDYDPMDIYNTNFKPKVFTFLLRDHKRYPQQAEFEKNLGKFYKVLHDEFDKTLGNADYIINFYDDEAQMLYELFKVQHIMKPDFTQIWNMSYDILYIAKRAMYLGVPPEALFCHPDFKATMFNYYLDERNKNDFKNRGDTFNCLSYTKYVDQMLGYAARRKGRSDYGSNGIDNIGKIEVKAQKRKFNSKKTNVINAAIREYFNFVLYNINDVVLQALIERHTGDLDDVFMRSYETGCRFDKANRMSVSLKTLYDISHFEQGYAMSNNLNADYISDYNSSEDIVIEIDSDSDNPSYEARLKGALVGNPTNLGNNGAEVFEGRKSNRLFLNLIDLDFASLYPNIKLVNNISKSSQYGRLIVLKKVSELEYGVTPELRGGEFLDDYSTHDWLKIGIKWFGLKDSMTYINEFRDFISRPHQILMKPKQHKHIFHSIWADTMSSLLSTLFPEYNNSYFIHNILKRDLKDVDCLMYNNYEDVEYEGTLLSIVDFIETEKPIITESGCFFKRPSSIAEISPGLVTLSNLGIKRSKIKKMELHCDEIGDKENARLYNLAQNRVKTFSNSEYGIGGAKSSFLYNYHVAQSVTSKGQTLISTAFTTFEDFLSDTIQFYDTDELIHYIMNISSDMITCDDNEYIDSNKSKKEVKERLLKKCCDIRNFDDSILDDLLDTCNQSVLNRLYYKNNLLEFLHDNKSIQKIIKAFDVNANTFLDLNKMNKSSRKYMDKILNVVLEYCHYNHHWYGRVERLIRMSRHSVITIDTDSNILTIHDVLKSVKKHLSKSSNHTIKAIENKVDSIDHRHFKGVNICASILTEVIKRSLQLFKENTHTTEHILGKYEMKNEFYYTAMLVNSGKKRYLGNIKLREGHYLPKGKRDVKGFDFIKTTYATKEVNDYIQDTLFNYVVTDKVNISKALNRFIQLENTIRTSLTNGESTYLTPAKVSTMDSYKNPMSTGSFKAVYIWNTLYPDQEIELPGVVNLIKLNISSPKDIAELALDDKELFDKICSLLKTKTSKGGLSEVKVVDNAYHQTVSEITQIAIPLDCEEIPEWILKYGDFDTMVGKTMNLVIPVLSELGIIPVFKRKSDKQLSNIIEIG